MSPQDRRKGLAQESSQQKLNTRSISVDRTILVGNIISKRKIIKDQVDNRIKLMSMAYDTHINDTWASYYRMEIDEALIKMQEKIDVESDALSQRVLKKLSNRLEDSFNDFILENISGLKIRSLNCSVYQEKKNPNYIKPSNEAKDKFEKLRDESVMKATNEISTAVNTQLQDAQDQTFSSLYQHYSEISSNLESDLHNSIKKLVDNIESLQSTPKQSPKFSERSFDLIEQISKQYTNIALKKSINLPMKIEDLNARSPPSLKNSDALQEFLKHKN